MASAFSANSAGAATRRASRSGFLQFKRPSLATIQDALCKAGFDTEFVHILDKGQPSIKGVKGLAGKEHVTNLDIAHLPATPVACDSRRTRPPRLQRA